MEWQRIGTEFSIDGLASDYKYFRRTEKPITSPDHDDIFIPRYELDVPVVEGEFTGYVYDSG